MAPSPSTTGGQASPADAGAGAVGRADLDRLTIGAFQAEAAGLGTDLQAGGGCRRVAHLFRNVGHREIFFAG